MKPETRINKFQKKIKELKKDDQNFDVIAEVSDVEEPVKGGAKEYQNLTIKDDTGTIKMTLFSGIGKLKVGDKIKIYRGYINTYEGENKVLISKYGGELNILK